MNKDFSTSSAMLTSNHVCNSALPYVAVLGFRVTYLTGSVKKYTQTVSTDCGSRRLSRSITL
jgi:hypothetical protein